MLQYASCFCLSHLIYKKKTHWLSYEVNWYSLCFEFEVLLYIPLISLCDLHVIVKTKFIIKKVYTRKSTEICIYNWM